MSKSYDEIEEKVKEIIADCLGVLPEDLSTQSSIDDFGGDVWNAYDIERDVETEYGVDLCGTYGEFVMLQTTVEEIALKVEGLL